MMLPNLSSKAGYAKIVGACCLAVEHNLDYIWIDTCCIDKSSSAELTETINSMFELYKNATVCFVYLYDLRPETSFFDGLEHYLWIHRGKSQDRLLSSPFLPGFNLGRDASSLIVVTEPHRLDPARATRTHHRKVLRSGLEM
jgi:hypothetical protein